MNKLWPLQDFCTHPHCGLWKHFVSFILNDRLFFVSLPSDTLFCIAAAKRLCIDFGLQYWGFCVSSYTLRQAFLMYLKGKCNRKILRIGNMKIVVCLCVCRVNIVRHNIAGVPLYAIQLPTPIHRMTFS